MSTRPSTGQQISVPLFTDKTASEQELARLVKLAERRESGLIDPFSEHAGRPLAELVADWQASVLNDGAGTSHANKIASCVRRIIDGCRFNIIADISASRVQQFLADLRKDRQPCSAIDKAKETYTRAELAALLDVKPSAIGSLVRRHRLTTEATGQGKARRYKRIVAEVLLGLKMQGLSIRTSNAHLSAMKQFCNWLVKDRRAAESPVAYLKGGNAKEDRRHDRRILDETELRSLILAANQSEVVFRYIAGVDRGMLYVVACASGYRVSELAALTPQEFHLDGDSPEIVLGGAFTKNGKPAIQPLPTDLVESLREYLAGRAPEAPVWPGTWFTRAADMIRIDLDVCGIPYIIQGPEGPLFTDFHCLRHSYVALLDKAGVTLKEAMQLARHSDPKLTAAIYGRARLQDLAGAVDRLPTLLAGSPAPGGSQRQVLRATGTDGSFLVDSCAPPDVSRGILRTDKEGSTQADGDEGEAQVLAVTNDEDASGNLTTIADSGPSRIRTCNQGIMSPLLCR
jgi:integrase